MAALLNAAALIGISTFLFKEAYYKFLNPQPINGSVVIWVALVGLAANTLGAFLLQKGSHGDMNIKSAYLHLLKKIDGVENVHHVHVWSLDERNAIFEAQVNVRDMLVSETKKNR